MQTAAGFMTVSVSKYFHLKRPHSRLDNICS